MARACCAASPETVHAKAEEKGRSQSLLLRGAVRLPGLDELLADPMKQRAAAGTHLWRHGETVHAGKRVDLIDVSAREESLRGPRRV